MIKNTCIDNYLSALLVDCDAPRQVAMLDNFIDIATALISNKNVWVFLNGPLMSTDEKQSFLETFSKQFDSDQRVLNVLKLIIKNKRLAMLSECVKRCSEKKDVINQVSKVTVISADALSSEQLNRLTQVLESVGYSNVQLSTRLDETMVAGFKVLTKNKVYDLSLDTVFSTFKDKLKRS